jgi:hypothetical protein
LKIRRMVSLGGFVWTGGRVFFLNLVGCDDFVRVGGPCEGLWHLICLCEEAVDSGLEIDDGSEDAGNSLLLQLGSVRCDGRKSGP